MLLFLLAFGPIRADDDPVAELGKWLQENAELKEPDGTARFFDQPLTRGQSRAAVSKLVDAFREHLTGSRRAEWKNKEIRLGDLSMKFEYKLFGKMPESGRSLFISMHGGGGAPPSVNDQQWRNQIGLYQPAEGVYLAPRAPTNTWNLWHQGHIDQFFERIIEDAILFEGVNPNRVYIMGYSAGGDGVYQLAPRMADQLAAAAMMAGHPNDASPLGLRNIGFTLHMGGKDSAYNRNGVARKWKTMLADLQKNDPDGYQHKVVIHENYGHWMNREDRVAVPWMAKFTRNPNPEKIVWRQASTTHDRFYWLAVDAKNRKSGSTVVVQRNGQTIAVEQMDGINKLILRLNDQMFDLDQPLKLTGPDGKSQTVEARRTIRTIFRCLTERFDPASIYTAAILFPTGNSN